MRHHEGGGLRSFSQTQQAVLDTASHLASAQTAILAGVTTSTFDVDSLNLAGKSLQLGHSSPLALAS